MIRLARVATDEKYANALHRDLLRDQQTLDCIGWLGLKAYIDSPPPHTALREAFDGPLTTEAIHAARIVRALEELTWNTRAIASGEWDEPYPQLKIPGFEVESEADSEPSVDYSRLDNITDIADFATPGALAILQGG